MRKCGIKRIISLIVLIAFAGALIAQSSDIVIDEAILEPKDPLLGTIVAIGPGLLAHGFGHFYAEDYRMGLMLLGGEVISLFFMGVGWYQMSNANDLTDIGGNPDEVYRGGMLSMIGGLIGFAVTYLADVVMAGRAAEQYNIEHNLEFKIQQESGIYTPGIMLSYTFN